MLVDTHTHLQWKSFNKDREEAIGRARKAGIMQIVNIGFDVNSSLDAIELAEKYEGLYATVGVHPHNASSVDEKTLCRMKELCNHSKVVAIGEIGLDYYRRLSPVNAQMKAFESQMHLAEELQLPVVIHDRDAHVDILKVLSKFRGRVSGVMHCYSGDKTMAETCVKNGFLISFAGTVTYSNSHMLADVAKSVDLNNILLETDCPWLTPATIKRKRNEPAFLVHTAMKIAELRATPLKKLAEVTTRNAKDAFRLPNM